MRLLEVKGDLFAASTNNSLAHCVSEDLKMSKGIADTFRKNFGQVNNLVSQNKKVGEVAHICDPINGQHVFYMITKSRYFEKPSYEALFMCLVELRDLCKKLGITHLAMPRIGCGLDKLSWDIVQLYLKCVFQNCQDLNVTIYTL